MEMKVFISSNLTVQEKCIIFTMILRSTKKWISLMHCTCDQYLTFAMWTLADMSFNFQPVTSCLKTRGHVIGLRELSCTVFIHQNLWMKDVAALAEPHTAMLLSKRDSGCGEKSPWQLGGVDQEERGKSWNMLHALPYIWMEHATCSNVNLAFKWLAI